MAVDRGPAAFHVMVKPTGPLCNLACQYCFYLEKEQLYPERREWAMSDAVVESFVRQYIESQPGPAVNFSWQGGEPTLLGVGFFRKVVELQQRYAAGRQIENSFQTNAVLLDEEWCDFLAQHQFLVGVSVDGPRELHDRYRLDRGGKPTFERVLGGMELLKRHGVAFNTLTVVQRDNSRHPLEVYRFLREAGSGFVQFIPAVERVREMAEAGGDSPVALPTGSRVSAWSVEPGEFGRFMCAVFAEWVRHDVGRVFVQLFDVALEGTVGIDPGVCSFATTCGAALALEHNGDLYACDHFVYPSHRLGNILDEPLPLLATSEAQLAFGTAKRDALTAYCRRCPHLPLCHGDCPKHRFVKSPDGEDGLSYLCEGYRLFFDYSRPYMSFMAGQLAQERPPANVMAWTHERDEVIAKMGRNDDCLCGSGLKLKKCCGRF